MNPTCRLRPVTALLGLAGSVLAGGCAADVEELRERFRGETPREAYEHALDVAGLTETALGRDWLAAAERALADPHPIRLPYREAGYLPPEQPTAIGYLLTARRGQQITVELELHADTAALVFIEVYRVLDDSARTLRLVAAGDSLARRAEFEARRDGKYVVRIQPELLRGGRYALTISTAGSLAFPVAGASTGSIASRFGAPRDGGLREHHGVDIFAPRGTPVLAAISGYVRRVRETPRGGKVVWLSDAERGQSLYYAHLDSQLVREGMWVEAGDTIGLVGNTGNARTTPPHLHFGIYRRGEGPVDPYWFLYRPDPPTARVSVDTSVLGRWTRATRDGIRLRNAPAEDAPARAELPRHTAMRVLAATGSWYRVRLPDGTVGFVAGRLLEQADDAVASERVAATLPLRSVPLPGALIVDSIAPGAEVPVLGRFGAYLLVQAPGGRTGWVEMN
jgi:murein DD-endopeptidase MepM/ murein hydrolase activator NlpD/SH3-like domain-containing protein